MQRWIVLPGVALAVLAWFVPLPFAGRLPVALAGLFAAVLGWIRPGGVEPHYFCARCGRFLGTRRRGIEIPCPECGGEEYFTPQNKVEM